MIVVVLAICANHCFFNASAESDDDLDKISSNKEAIVDKANKIGTTANCRICNRSFLKCCRGF